MERMSNAINVRVEELREHLKKYYDETIYLETRLDRAKRDNEKLEKENKWLWEENKKLKEYNGELIENHKKDIDILCEENKKLKSDLSECECSFGFESDEVGYRKREYKRLKKWIKDHCKGYGNLFPEDEMKRQRKKADKKRK